MAKQKSPPEALLVEIIEPSKVIDEKYRTQIVTLDNGRTLAGVIVSQDDVLVFDTFSRASTARTELAEIRKITDKPVRYVVNSHHHPDHWSGNEVYAEAFPNLEIIASEASRQYMLALAKSWPPVWTGIILKAQTDLDKEVSTGKEADGTPLTAGRPF